MIKKILKKILKPSLSDPAMIYPHKLEIIEGKLVCLDLIPSGSTIISGGIGNDTKFEFELMKKKGVLVIGIDPTSTAEKYIESKKAEVAELNNRYIYLKKALNNTNEKLKLYYGENDFMSSLSSQHRDTKESNYFYCECVTIDDLQKTYSNISYLKLDIEGAEYNILKDLKHISIPQISIEFHHHCSTEYTLQQTISAIQNLVEMGYDVVDYGAFHGAGRKLQKYVSKWSDLNCELLFIKK
ncbi:MAG: FkbM family methyltransferase [Bacteroidetes bacterium]|nr:FkbM family methyltransferase [Bacteroidota bacterium]